MNLIFIIPLCISDLVIKHIEIQSFRKSYLEKLKMNIKPLTF